MSSLSGVSLGGGPSLGRVGGWWDDLTGGSVEPVIGGSSGGDNAKQSPGALPQIPYGSGCPSGMMPDPVNPSQFCVYDAKAQQAAASCPAGTGYDPVTGKCAPKEWGGIQAGQCPAGQTPYNGKCVPVKQCPAGYNYALDKQTCEKSYTTGSTGGGLPAVKPQPVPDGHTISVKPVMHREVANRRRVYIVPQAAGKCALPKHRVVFYV
jgi:hypothetical protein